MHLPDSLLKPDAGPEKATTATGAGELGEEVDETGNGVDILGPQLAGHTGWVSLR